MDRPPLCQFFILHPFNHESSSRSRHQPIIACKGAVKDVEVEIAFISDQRLRFVIKVLDIHRIALEISHVFVKNVVFHQDVGLKLKQLIPTSIFKYVRRHVDVYCASKQSYVSLEGVVLQDNQRAFCLFQVDRA